MIYLNRYISSYNNMKLDMTVREQTDSCPYSILYVDDICLDGGACGSAQPNHYLFITVTV